jgi:hypothetical protein
VSGLAARVAQDAVEGGLVADALNAYFEWRLDGGPFGGGPPDEAKRLMRAAIYEAVRRALDEVAAA